MSLPTADELRAIVARHEENQRLLKEEPDHWRTCPDHARVGALLVLLRALANGVDYRPGLPSVEQVRAHEELGGWWQIGADIYLDFVRLVVNEGTIMENIPGGVYFDAAEAFPTGAQLRPCLPPTDDNAGAPCAWPGEPDPWAALEALR